MGLKAIMLQVEEKNAPAKGLYEAVGYQHVHTDEAATATRVNPGNGSEQLLREEATTLVLMGKGLPQLA